MSEQTYPSSCQSCRKQLYGPVTYCPFCAVHCAAAPTGEAADESATVNKVSEKTVATPTPENISAQQPPPSQDEPAAEGPSEPMEEGVAPEIKSQEQKSKPASEKVEKPKTEPPRPVPPPPPPKPWKWIAFAVVLVFVIGGYLISHKKGGGGDSLESSGPVTQGQSQKETARIVAQDALRQGTSLSLTISKLPKLEGVLKAAKSLGDISPRYQEQVTSAENTLKTAQTDRDKSVLAYFGKVAELGRYKPDQISYAMGVIQGGDITPREKAVAELLSKQVNFLRSSGNSDPKKLLSEFTHRFSDFVD